MGFTDATASPISGLPLTWLSFFGGLLFFILYFVLSKYALEEWYDDDLDDKRVALFEFGVILFAIGLPLLLGSLNRLFIFQTNYYPREVTMVFLIICIILSIVIGFVYFFKWKGVSLLTWDADALEAGTVTTSVYLFLLCMIFFVVFSFILLRMCLFSMYYDSDEYNDGGNASTSNNNNNTNDTAAVGTSSSVNSNYTSMADKEPLIGGNTNDKNGNGGVRVVDEEKGNYGSVDSSERVRLAINKNREYYSGYDRTVEYAGVICFVLFVVGLLFLNGILPSDWDGFYVAGIESFNEDTSTAGWVINVAYTYKGADYYLKIFGDLIVYFGFIVIVTLLSWMAMKNVEIRMLLRTRIVSLFAGPIQISMSLGELLFWILWCVLMFVEMYYWLGVHIYDDTTDLALSQYWARSLGVLACIFMSFMLFTVSRIRLWNDVFGLSSDHLIFLHRVFANCMIICTYAHMFFWIAYFANNSTYTLDDNWIFVASLPFTYNDSNWTIAMAQAFGIFFIPIVYFIFASSYVRNKFFELFYIIHVFGAIVFVSFMFWHATQSWRFMLPPLVLYVIDRCLRFYNSTNFARVESINNIKIGDSDEIVTMSVSVAQVAESSANAYFGKLRYQMGQFCYINLPTISPLEWHPFTISSNPFDRQTTFHIKSMGRDQFSGKLCELADNYKNENNGGTTNNNNSGAVSSLRDIEFHIDGPYGIPFDYSGYDRVVLVAGGIGVTPCHAIFSGMLAIAKVQVEHGDDNGVNVPFVHLIWMARDPAMFGLFAQTWKEAETLGRNSNFIFSIDFYHTRANNAGQKVTHESGVSYTTGKPQLENTLLFLKDQKDENSIVFCCGPAGLATKCEEVATKYDSHFYAESFDFSRGGDIKLFVTTLVCMVVWIAIMGAICDRYE